MMIKYKGSYVLKRFLISYGTLLVLSIIFMVIRDRTFIDYVFPIAIFPVLILIVHLSLKKKSAIDIEDNKLVYYELFISRKRYEFNKNQEITFDGQTLVIPIIYKNKNKNLVIKDIYEQSLKDMYFLLLNALKERFDGNYKHQQ